MLRADDMLILLEVARCGTLVGAGQALGLDHTTVSRRITAVEQELGSPVVIRSAQGCRMTDLGRAVLDASERIEDALADVRNHAQRPTSAASLKGLVRLSSTDGFGLRFVTPVLSRLQRQHPELLTELVLATRPVVQSIGADIEIGVGQPSPRKSANVPLSPYVIGLYASGEYLQQHGEPRNLAEVARHPLVFYIEPLMRVTDLTIIHQYFSNSTIGFASTSVFSHVEATRCGAGLGLLPAFLADRVPELKRVLPKEVSIKLDYVASIAPRVMRRPAAMAVMAELTKEVQSRRNELLGLPA